MWNTLKKLVTYLGQQKLILITVGIPLFFLIFALGAIVVYYFSNKLYELPDIVPLSMIIIILWLSLVVHCIYLKQKH